MSIAKVNVRYQKPLSAETLNKLESSKRAAEKLIRREIKCPNCGFNILEVYGTDHHITRVKCQKCKFNELIDTAMFRTVKVKKHTSIHPQTRCHPYR